MKPLYTDHLELSGEDIMLYLRRWMRRQEQKTAQLEEENARLKNDTDRLEEENDRLRDDNVRQNAKNLHLAKENIRLQNRLDELERKLAEQNASQRLPLKSFLDHVEQHFTPYQNPDAIAVKDVLFALFTSPTDEERARLNRLGHKLPPMGSLTVNGPLNDIHHNEQVKAGL